MCCIDPQVFLIFFLSYFSSLYNSKFCWLRFSLVYLLIFLTFFNIKFLIFSSFLLTNLSFFYFPKPLLFFGCNMLSFFLRILVTFFFFLHFLLFLALSLFPLCPFFSLWFVCYIFFFALETFFKCLLILTIHS